MHVYRIVRTAAEVAACYMCTLIEASHTYLELLQCKSSQLHHWDRAHWQRLTGTLSRQAFGVASCNRSNCVGCRYWISAPRASGHSIVQQSKVWHADLAEHLGNGKYVTTERGKVEKILPCLLIVSPYVRANFGRSFPILSYSS